MTEIVEHLFPARHGFILVNVTELNQTMRRPLVGTSYGPEYRVKFSHVIHR